jgi:hypothetical protein
MYKALNAIKTKWVKYCKILKNLLNLVKFRSIFRFFLEERISLPANGISSKKEHLEKFNLMCWCITRSWLSLPQNQANVHRE